MKAVIYARYSSDNQREESIEGQIRECKSYAERNGIIILTSYIDRAFSAKTDNRPEFQKMIKDSAKGLFDAIIVWKLDRFARNRYDSAHYKAILKKNGVKVLSAMEAIAEDSTGILLESLLEGYAEFYSAELSEKVIRGRTENALKCKWNGGCLPVGLMVDSERHYILDPLTAPAVLEAFKLYANGKTVKQIANILNEKGIRSRHNKPLSIDSITNMLHNRKYIGEYKYRDIIHENGIPAIVPIELFEKVQNRLAKNKKAPARYKAKEENYLLTTKLLCGKCGAFMVGESGTSKTGRIYQYYKCVTAKTKKACKKKTVKKDWIEDLVVSETMNMIMDDSMVLYITDLVMEIQSRENTDLPRLRKQLTETEKAIENMLNAIQQGIFNQFTKQRFDELEASKNELETKILQEEIQRPLLKREQVAFWLHRFRKLDVTIPEQRQLLIDTFVNAIYLYDDRLVVTFNYKDGSKTITIDDIKSSDLTEYALPKRSKAILCSVFFVKKTFTRFFASIFFVQFNMGE